MKKSHRESLQNTLALAATVAALGASLGVPEQALAAQKGPSTKASVAGAPRDKTEVIRHKTQRSWGANKIKWSVTHSKTGKVRAPEKEPK